ncbi:hypothetical protein ARMA_1517 [Ardenticatena maritima]|uniref:Uncharacterized protein n=1 Tax=Ardenticatena maritima TaxID=872965 RepID=A0A0M9UCL7_9CHLR|nr:hypothetical protein ARMA_1517 [Ardenticatena maritima]
MCLREKKTGAGMGLFSYSQKMEIVLYFSAKVFLTPKG